MIWTEWRMQYVYIIKTQLIVYANFITIFWQTSYWFDIYMFILLLYNSPLGPLNTKLSRFVLGISARNIKLQNIFSHWSCISNLPFSIHAIHFTLNSVCTEIKLRRGGGWGCGGGSLGSVCVHTVCVYTPAMNVFLSVLLPASYKVEGIGVRPEPGPPCCVQRSGECPAA